MENNTLNKHIMERVDAISASFDVSRKYRDSAFMEHEIKIEAPKVIGKETYTDTEVSVRVTASAFDHTTIAAIAKVVNEKPISDGNRLIYNAGLITAGEDGGVVAIITFTELVYKSKEGGAQ